MVAFRLVSPIAVVTLGFAFSAGAAQTSDSDFCDTTIGSGGAYNLIRAVAGQPTDGTSGADEICGTEGPDVIRGGGGNDAIEGEAGDDAIEGGSTLDSHQGGLGDDVIESEAGDDGFVPGDGVNTCRGGPGTDCSLPNDPCQFLDSIP